MAWRASETPSGEAANSALNEILMLYVIRSRCSQDCCQRALMIKAHFRHSGKSDAPLLAELVNYAGEGMPLYLWGKLARPGETAGR
jgi:hypothetical protein